MTDDVRHDFDRFTGPNAAGSAELASAYAADVQDNARLPIDLHLSELKHRVRVCQNA